MARPMVSTINRTEYIGDISLPTLNSQVMLATNGGLIPNDRFIKKMYLQWEGRVVNAGSNNPTGMIGVAMTHDDEFDRRGIQTEFLEAVHDLVFNRVIINRIDDDDSIRRRDGP